MNTLLTEAFGLIIDCISSRMLIGMKSNLVIGTLSSLVTGILSSIVCTLEIIEVSLYI